MTRPSPFQLEPAARIRAVAAVAVAAAAVAAASARADLAIVGASRDGTLYESGSGSIANGAGEYLFAGKSNQSLARRGVLFFDLAAAVPEGATIVAARLTLNLVQLQGGARVLRLHRATTAWTTGLSNAPDNEGSGAAALAGDATWLHASADGLGGGATWTAAGGDFAAAASASLVSTALGLHVWESPALLDDVRAFASDPSANLGWFLLGDETAAGTSRRFESMESAAIGGIVPRLEIEFTTVPAPQALAALLVAPLARTRRRR